MTKEQAYVAFSFKALSLAEIKACLAMKSVAVLFCCNDCWANRDWEKDSLIVAAANNARLFFASSRESLWRELMEQAVLFSIFDYKIVDDDFLKEEQQLLEDAKKTSQTRILNIEQTAKVNIRNSLSLLKPSLDSVNIKDFSSKFKGVPAFVVAAGPSLSKNILQLQKVKNRALILAVDTAAKLLKEHDISPDFIFSGDFRDKSKYLSGIEDGIPLVYHLECSSETVLSYKGPKVIWESSTPLARWVASLGAAKGDSERGMSVASMALNAALLFGADPVVFVGQDFAYTGGDVYAQGIEQGHETKKENGKEFRVESRYDGSELLTKKEFYIYLRYTENRIQQLAGKFINATEGGTGIANTENLPLKDVVEKYCISELGIEGTIAQLIKRESIYDRSLVRTKVENKLKELLVFKENLNKVKYNLDMALEEESKAEGDRNLIALYVKKMIESLKSVWGAREQLSYLHAFVTVALAKMSYAEYLALEDQESKILKDFQFEYNFVVAALNGVEFLERELGECLKDL